MKYGILKELIGSIRLEKVITRKRELLEEFEPIKMLFMKDKNNVYTAFTGFISGDQLYNLYDKWGTRLLERNVRAYLQNRGKVNKGIRNTIKVEPELFLAFNNGLTITADNITMRFIDDQQCQIEKLTDFQIVNGGQTCASIWHAKEQDKTDITIFSPNKIDSSK